MPWVVGGLIFAACFIFRLTTANFTNDDYLHLSMARQVLAGDLPLRDFIDPGEPLFYYSSAAFQVLVSHSLLGEAVLDALCLSIGYALAYFLSFHLTGSLAISGLCAAAGVLSYPRLYSYPKIFLYVLALVLIWRYVDTRRDRALVWIGVVAALAFLFRHDHGLYVACAVLATLLLTHWRGGAGVWIHKLFIVGGTASIVLLPYLFYVQAYKGVVLYLRTTIETSRAEHDRTVGSYPTFDFGQASSPPARVNILWAASVTDAEREALAAHYRLSSAAYQGGSTWSYAVDDPSTENIADIVGDPNVVDTHNIDRARFTLVESDIQNPNATPWLYYLTMSLPVVALLVVARRWYARVKRDGADARSQDAMGPWTALEIKVAAAAVLHIAANAYLLRAAKAVVIPDVSALSAVIGAWLVAVGLNLASSTAVAPARRRPFSLGFRAPVRAGITMVIVALTAMALGESAGGQALDLFRARLWEYGPGYVADHVRSLKMSRAPFPSRAARYVFECTEDTDRLFVSGYAPQIYYHSGRAFAGGQVYFNSSLGTAKADQRFSLERLEQERVPIVLHPTDDDEFAGTFALIDGYLDARYREVGEIDAFGAPLTVFVDRRRDPVGTFGPDALPCFRSRRDDGKLSSRDPNGASRRRMALTGATDPRESPPRLRPIVRAAQDPANTDCAYYSQAGARTASAAHPHAN